uniref:Serine/threonine-protein phosphatase n=1 Tax=Syphacia muris TaxID=451379 RepID=A0A0N5A901_9BILA
MATKFNEKLIQAEIEEGISSVLRQPYPYRSQIDQLIPEQLIIKFLLYGTEIMRRESMLVEFEFSDKCSVVGDLHGNINDLIGVIYENGDYVGRGECQLDVFITVLLMKLRWPKYVCMLRGNHECQDQSEGDGFEQACLEAYQNIAVFKLFVQLFNYMPVSAIINDQILCCHGGISQWMISREAIRNIPRPTNVKSMKMLENCLLTDILWSDPEFEQLEPFLPSQRGISFSFNEEALNNVFHYLRCKLLIRGHECVKGGICEEVGGKCLTVHTTPMLNGDLAPAFIVLRTSRILSTEEPSNILVDISKNSRRKFSADYSDPIWTELLKNFILRSFSYQPLTYLETINHQAVQNYLDTLTPQQRPQHITHLQMSKWILTFAPEIFGIVRNCYPDFQGFMLSEFFPRYFPLIYDVCYGKGFSFRIGLSAGEKDLLKKVLMACIFNLDSVGCKPLALEEWPLERFDTEEVPKRKRRKFSRKYVANLYYKACKR